MRPIPPERFPDPYDSSRGLTSEQASHRRTLYGFNDIVTSAPATWIDLIRDTVRDPMIWFLIGVSVLFTLLGEYREALVLMAALLPLAGMDAYLHRRTQASTEGLASRLASGARVFRDVALMEVPARELVPGDLVVVRSGDPMPADGLFVSGVGLQVDESSLTGESHPARKQVLSDASAPAASAANDHWAFAGTRLLTGTAHVRIVWTGRETLYGEIVRSAVLGQHTLTPLQRAVGRLVTIILGAAMALCVLLAVIRFIQGHGIADAILSSATLAVAALPEEFPVVLTFFLGVGVYRLARRQALVRRGVAVENIGRVSCICTDKTGTLTEGRLVLSHSLPFEGISVDQLLQCAAAAARAESGDPLDLALIATAPPQTISQRRATFPFTEHRRRETAIIILPDGRTFAVTKGAPETVYAMCGLDTATDEQWRKHASFYAASGHKVIAAASRQLSADAKHDIEPSSDFTLHGILAFEDPLHEGVREAVEECRAGGIRVIMITGDHPATAEAIARDIGLGDGNPVVMLADHLDADGHGPAHETLLNVDVVARAAPAQKLRLVQSLQKVGEIVAVTGDGVNDVPALKAADIGIAMGERGTQSAREVAAIVLLDDNFSTIVRAVAEGRQLFRNLQLSFAYLLLVHIPLVISATVIPVLDNPLLYLPIHIVWLELIIHPTALLVFQDLPAPDGLRPIRRDGVARFFSTRTWLAIAASGLVFSAIISGGFELALGESNDAEHARSIALGILICASSAATIILSGLSTSTSRAIALGQITSLVVLVQIEQLASLMHLRPLHFADWSIVVGAGAIAGLLVLIVKATMNGSVLSGTE